MILPVLFALPSSDDAHVGVGNECLPDSSFKGLQKVELDLDDALFLEFNDKDDVTPKPPVQSVSEHPLEIPLQIPPNASSRPAFKNRMIIATAGILGCLLLGLSGAYFFSLLPVVPGDRAQSAAEQDQTQTSAPATAPPKTQEPLSTPESQGQFRSFAFDQFYTEHTQGDRIRFLTCRFNVPNTSAAVHREIQGKMLLIRDAVYRYLKNSNLTFLSNPGNSEKLKQDIAAVINQHLQSGQVSQIFLEEYVLK